MNAAGQALTELIILLAIFVVLLSSLAKNLPITLKDTTPYLNGQVEARLQTGVGFAKTGGQGTWSPSIGPKGGIKDE